MHKITLLILFLLCNTKNTEAQNNDIYWSQEQLKTGLSDINLFHVDDAAIYFEESYYKRINNFSYTTDSKTTTVLFKVDWNLNEVFRKSYRRELGKKKPLQLFSIKNELYLIAYRKKGSKLEYYAGIINKDNGHLINGIKKVSDIKEKKTKKFYITKLTTNADSTELILVHKIDHTNYKISKVDYLLQKPFQTYSLNNPHDPLLYYMQNIYFAGDSIIVIGHERNNELDRRKNIILGEVTKSRIDIFNVEGKIISKDSMFIPDHHLYTPKVIYKDHKINILAFYGKYKGNRAGITYKIFDTKNDLQIEEAQIPITEDFLKQHIDVTNNKIYLPTKKQIHKPGFILNENFHFNDIYYTPDNQLLLIAEQHHQKTEHISTMNFDRTSKGYIRTTIGSGNILLFKIADSFNISWIKRIPKNQLEIYSNMYMTVDEFEGKLENSLYSGHFSYIKGNELNIIYNDLSERGNTIRTTDSLSTVSSFRKSSAYKINIQLEDGSMSQKWFFDNDMTRTFSPQKTKIVDQLGMMVGIDLSIIYTRKYKLGFFRL